MVSVVMTLASTGRRMAFPVSRCRFEEADPGKSFAMVVYHGDKSFPVKETLDDFIFQANSLVVAIPPKPPEPFKHPPKSRPEDTRSFDHTRA